MLTLLVVAGTVSYALWPRNSATEATAAGMPPGGARSAPPTPTGQLAPTGNASARQDQGQGFMSTIQNLKGTRNWNEVVAQALAWTQKEPGNAAAWNELSIGYTNMQQRDDAHAAARRAVDLAPKNALYWRNLGDLNLDRDAPVEALLAFDEATSWNTQDGYSFVQTGILNARLDRLPEAKVAFAKALALNPNDTNARCGAALITRRMTLSRESAKSELSADGVCRDLIERASAPANLMGPTASSGAASGSR
jgi:tetratricopeptide (TPR) repeat protein